MKILWTSLLVAGFFIMPALAENQKAPTPSGPGRGDPEARLQRLADRVGLSEDQRQRLSALMQKHLGEAKALRENAALSPEDRRAQLSALRQQHRAEVAALLTPEQRAAWEAARERMREARPERPRPLEGGKEAKKEAKGLQTEKP